MGFCLDALPASVEIIEPEHFQQDANALNGILNDLVGRLHETDMVVKNLRSQIELLDRNTVQTFRNFIKFSLKDTNLTAEELSTIVGVDLTPLKPFLDKMVEENLLRVSDDKYSI